MYGMVLVMALSGSGDAAACHGCCAPAPVYSSSCGGCYHGGVSHCGPVVHHGCVGGVVHHGCASPCGPVVHHGCPSPCGPVVHHGCVGGVVHQGCCGTVVSGCVVVSPTTPMTPIDPKGTPDKVPAPDKKPMDKPDDKKPDDAKPLPKPGDKPADKPGDKPADKPGDKPKDEGLISTSATLVVTLPEDAKLTLSNIPLLSTSAEREITLSALESGKEFEYTLRAELVRDGQTLSVTKTIKLTAGQDLRVAFDLDTFANSLAAK